MTTKFTFTPPDTPERVILTIERVPAIVLFRAATLTTLSEAKHYLIQNLGEGDYDPREVGQLIEAYYKYKRE